jgi:acetyl esterase/lipase
MKYLNMALILSLLVAIGCARMNPVPNRYEPIPFQLGGAVNAAETGTAGRGYGHVNADTAALDVIRHPAFEGFGRFLLPAEYKTPDEQISLKKIGSLLPYHNYINVDTIVKVVNHLIDEVNAGKTVFYDYYTGQQEQADPSKENTGLFFFRGEMNAPFAIVCPGGGFSYVGSIHEGFPYALELSRKGYNAFVIQYRVGSEQYATEDLAAAISWVSRNAETLQVRTRGYSLWGSSAGARMAARIGSYGVAFYGGDDLPKPSAVIMAYTGHSDYTRDEPPTFVVVGERDGIANPSAMERRANALRDTGTVVEFHKYPNLGHGFGLGIGTSAEGWIEDAISFWGRQIP